MEVTRNHVSSLRRMIETHPHLGPGEEQKLDELADILEDWLDARDLHDLESPVQVVEERLHPDEDPNGIPF